MEMRFLNNLPKEEALDMVVNGVQQLTKDHALNVRDGLFVQLFGRELTMEEFFVMMIMEKDIALKAAFRALTNQPIK
jgi:hypothetical protein